MIKLIIVMIFLSFTSSTEHTNHENCICTYECDEYTLLAQDFILRVTDPEIILVDIQ